MNISFDFIFQRINRYDLHRIFLIGFSGATLGSIGVYSSCLQAAEMIYEPVQACILARDADLNDALRANLAHCLGWQTADASTRCQGSYRPLVVESLAASDEVQIRAKNVSFYHEGTSELSGNVEVRQTGRIVNAQTAYIYRDAQSKKVTRIELLGDVNYLEPDRLMIARKVTINPQDKSGKAEDVLYRFNSKRPGVVLPAWGRASLIERFANKDYFLARATYSVCAPQDDAWHLEAQKITLDDATESGVARDAVLYVGKVPVLYTPYLTFPTSKKRKSGFLLPTIGISNVQGFNIALPYYWNIAPNYDATLIPHYYSRRGMMMGGQFRYLTERSVGQVYAHYLPHDRAYRLFLNEKSVEFPQLATYSSDRWSVRFNDLTQITANLRLRIDYQQVSDDYYLQDFSNNFAILTERQLLREGELSYTTDNWFFRGMLQSYQTLQPVNQTPVAHIYERLPQLLARGNYDDLPFNGNFALLGQYDNFHWPNDLIEMPQGGRFYVNPILSLPQLKPWGFVTPAVELVQNYYDLTRTKYFTDTQFQRTIPRYSLDSGLYFDKDINFLNQSLTQTLEPHVYYLYVPYYNQSEIPSFDSAYMIFNTDQLFRTNRFSGFDRIGDTNQISYALTTRWLSNATGMEKALFTIGQIHYFSDRRVQLCREFSDKPCFDNPLMLGYLSPTASWSPIASRAVYHFNPFWQITGDYVWDVDTHKTNNAHMDFRYQTGVNQQVSFGYSYLVNGDFTHVAYSQFEDNALHQATFSYAWPFNAKWSTLGAFNYNISKRYEMMSLFGVQYDNCCWAVRLLGGHVFQSLTDDLNPRYNTNIYLQVLLKGLITVGNNDPASIIRTFIPGYVNSFHQ